MEPRFACTYTPTVKKVAEHNRKLHPIRTLISMVFGVMFSGYLTITAWEFEFQGIWKLYFLIGVIYFFWFMAMPEINAYFYIRRMRKSMGCAPVIEIAFGDSIEITENTIKVIWEYRDIHEVKKYKHTYVLMKNKNMGITIDPNGFTVGNFHDFKQFLREKYPNMNIPE